MKIQILKRSFVTPYRFIIVVKQILKLGVKTRINC